jgi:hypothetical protein
VSINDSYFHDANVGHEIKSRAASTTVTNSRILDNNSTASYSIDTPNGGNVNISGNVIEQGPNSENFYIFAWGEEGASQGGSETISNNTIVNDRDGARGVLSPTPVSFTGNQIWNVADLGNVAASGNVDLTSRPSLDTSSLSFINPSGGSDGSGTGGDTGGGTGGSGGDTGGGTAGTGDTGGTGTTLTLDEYHAIVATDFMNYFFAHHEVLSNFGALSAFFTEFNSTTVLTSPVPGDLWS